MHGTAVLKGNFDPKSLELVLSTLQAATLLLFNEAEELSYSEVQERLNLKVGLCCCSISMQDFLCASRLCVVWSAFFRCFTSPGLVTIAVKCRSALSWRSSTSLYRLCSLLIIAEFSVLLLCCCAAAAAAALL